MVFKTLGQRKPTHLREALSGLREAFVLPLQPEKLRLYCFPSHFELLSNRKLQYFIWIINFVDLSKVENHWPIHGPEVYTWGKWSSINDLPHIIGTSETGIQNPASCLSIQRSLVVCYLGMRNGFRFRRPRFSSWLYLEAVGWSQLKSDFCMT